MLLMAAGEFQFWNLVSGREAWSKSISCAFASYSSTKLDQSFLKESSWLSSHQSKCLLLGYLTILTALIQIISYRFKSCKEFSSILYLF